MEHLLSQRIRLLSPSATITQHQQVVALQRQGHDIINLSIGEPDFLTPLPIQQAAKQAIDTKAYFSYPPIAGYTDLRQAIADKFYKENGIPCLPEQIIVSNGAKQSLSNIFACLLNPGDEIVVYAPCWGSYLAIIQWAGGIPVLIHGTQETNFEATLAQLAQAITPKTKAIIFSNPCNPTGHVFSQQYFEAMITIVNKHPHVLVIADEIYEYINFTATHVSIGALQGIQDRVITINGFSKGFAMTGWRIGYMVAPIWLANACEKIQGQTTGAPSSIAQRAALAAIQMDKSVLQTMNDTYRTRRDYCLAWLADIPGFRTHTPQGAFFLFPDVSYYFYHTDGHMIVKNADALCQYLLKTARVSLVSGRAFGAPNCIRISYAATKEQLRIAFQRIKEALHQLKQV